MIKHVVAWRACSTLPEQPKMSSLSELIVNGLLLLYFFLTFALDLISKHKHFITQIKSKTCGAYMHNKIKRGDSSTATRLSKLAKIRLTIPSAIEESDKVSRKIKLPFLEADLLNGLDAYGAHANELVQLFSSEMRS